ncbi:MAG: pyridoxal-phosphate dependent enzyme [Sphingomonadales bacterium]|nr:pyridoxal-phosphate dependent enzyme [Sphingomonadales bacterium]
MWYENILQTIGNTPLVRLNKLCSHLPATVLAKVETFNPGHSTKDRMALKMIEDAEAAGLLKPGYTIIEGTSGNTGMGLAMAAVVKGYRCIFTTTDKQSREKVDALRALGAEVIVCPTNVDPEDPRSYYSVSSRLAQETPNAWKANQYDNLSNRQAHFEQTGPEIWEQTEGRVTHLVVGVGTGGTISGTASFLKSKNPAIKVWGIDTYGSVFKKYKETGIFDKQEIYPYVTEGIGEDFLPANVDFDLIDLFEKVTDRDAALMTRRIAREEGIFAGNSAGSAMAGLLQLGNQLKPTDVVVVIFHDHGTRYLNKMFNDEWMRERGYLSDTAEDAAGLVLRRGQLPLVKVGYWETVGEAVAKMRKHQISQVPVQDAEGTWVGSLSERKLLQKLLSHPQLSAEQVENHMEAPFAEAESSTKVQRLLPLIRSDSEAIMVRMPDHSWHILTQHDLLSAFL